MIRLLYYVFLWPLLQFGRGAAESFAVLTGRAYYGSMGEFRWRS